MGPDLHQEIFKEPIRVENGFITPPTGAGPGGRTGLGGRKETVIEHRRIS